MSTRNYNNDPYARRNDDPRMAPERYTSRNDLHADDDRYAPRHADSRTDDDRYAPRHADSRMDADRYGYEDRVSNARMSYDRRMDYDRLDYDRRMDYGRDEYDARGAYDRSPYAYERYERGTVDPRLNMDREPERKPRRRAGIVVAAALALALCGAGGTYAIMSANHTTQAPKTEQTQQVAKKTASSTQETTQKSVEETPKQTTYEAPKQTTEQTTRQASQSTQSNDGGSTADIMAPDNMSEDAIEQVALNLSGHSEDEVENMDITLHTNANGSYYTVRYTVDGAQYSYQLDAASGISIA